MLFSFQTQPFHKCVRSVVSVCAVALDVDWDDTAPCTSRSDTGFGSLSTGLAPSRAVSGSVTGRFRPYFRRYSYRCASHRTKCLFPCADSHVLHPGVGVHHSRSSSSSPSGLRYEGVALSLMTSEPLFSISTDRRTVLTRTTCPISFTARCPSLSSVRPNPHYIDRNVRGTPFATTRTPPGFRSDGTKHATIANNGRIRDLYGLPVRNSNDVAPPWRG